ncbi:hypothetical protein EC957_000174 [Mortierella hygrophila]|uniref:Superoxide dismutase copper/zinc binding domain-containing protein n=1 Tax=Mortierella hygrophila TaxID=979708 RepID=A0A9P6FGL4_9FUNG|nr:hypothetical protein EC957_000174 [Mortierella hygrophila]
MLQKTCVVTFLATLATTTLALTGESQVAFINMGGIVGKFTFSPLPDRQGGGGGASVVIDIKSGLTSELEIQRGVGFEYHIHVKQVGANNNCEATGGHLDPDPAKPGVVPCDPYASDTCQVGDLSGKHGNLEVTPKGDLQLKYIDRQLKFIGDATTIVGRSLVIHNNGTRIACANILPASQTTSANGLPTPLPNANQQGTSSYSLQGGSGDGDNGRMRSNNAHPSEGRFVSSEAMWTAVGSVACGVIAALMAF